MQPHAERRRQRVKKLPLPSRASVAELVSDALHLAPTSPPRRRRIRRLCSQGLLDVLHVFGMGSTHSRDSGAIVDLSFSLASSPCGCTTG